MKSKISSIASATISQSKLALIELKKISTKDFEYLKSKGILRGEWEDVYWSSYTCKIWFSKSASITEALSNNKGRPKGIPLVNTEEIIIKSIISDIFINNLKHSTASQAISVLRLFPHYINNDIKSWSEIDNIIFNKIQKDLKISTKNKFTYYHKITKLRKIRNFLNNIGTLKSSRYHRFLKKPITWECMEKNPSHKIY